MKLSEYRNRANEYSAKASDIARQMILGGIGIIWLFKFSDKGQETLDSFLLWPLAILALAVLSDLMQYITGHLIWINFYHKKEKEGLQLSKDKEFDIKAPRGKNLPVYIFYCAKMGLMIIAYAFLITFLFSKIKIS